MWNPLETRGPGAWRSADSTNIFIWLSFGVQLIMYEQHVHFHLFPLFGLPVPLTVHRNSMSVHPWDGPRHRDEELIIKIKRTCTSCTKRIAEKKKGFQFHVYISMRHQRWRCDVTCIGLRRPGKPFVGKTSLTWTSCRNFDKLGWICGGLPSKTSFISTIILNQPQKCLDLIVLAEKDYCCFRCIVPSLLWISTQSTGRI